MNRAGSITEGLLTGAYAGFALLPAVLLLITGQMSNIIPFHIAARFFAVTAYSMLMLQPLLSARFIWLERIFGLDTMLAFHRVTGVMAAVFALLHPLMLALGSKSFALWFSSQAPWQLLAGRITLVLLLGFGAAAVFRRGLRIPFQIWFRMHSCATLPVLAGVFLHSWFIAVKFMPHSVRYIWIFLAGCGVFSYLHLTVYKRLKNRLRAFTVKEVRQVTDNVWELEMSPPKGRSLFKYQPGQFLFVTFLKQTDLNSEEHPFTISSSPEDDALQVSIKESGDFTSTIGRCRKGTHAAVMAPFGKFSYLNYKTEDRIVFIAGGIGITPFLSMIRFMDVNGYPKPVTLFYGNRQEKDIAYREELKEIELNSSGSLQVVHVLSRAGEGWSGEKGRITPELMKRFSLDLQRATYFICGPPMMMESLSAGLLLEEVPSGRIIMERFSF